MSRSPPLTSTGSDNRFKSGLSRRFGIDTRALAALRIAMGGVILLDLFYRRLNLTAFYTDRGVFPRSALAEIRPLLGDLSLHAISGSLGFQVALFVVLALAALALMVGYKTRVATVVCFILLGSLHIRNPYVLNAGDSTLLMLLFWSLFLPLGERFSLDARHHKEPVKHVADLASAAILLQVILIYSMNAYFKFDAGHWVSGEAIQYTFNIDRFSTPLGGLLAHFPDLLVVAGWGWLVLLATSVLLVLTTGRLRVVLVALFFSVHLGMLVTMRLGVFPLISMAALLPFLPPGFWDHVSKQITASGSYRRLRDRFPVKGTKGERAPLAVFGSRWARSARTPFVSVSLVLLLLWSGFSLGVVALPGGLQEDLKGHERGWAMFANPSRSDVWYVAPATLENGETVDALHGDETPWFEPTHVDSVYPDIRWRKYLAEFHRAEAGDLPEHFAAYLCHRWDAKNDEKLESLTIYRISQSIRLDGPDPPPTKSELIARSC